MSEVRLFKAARRTIRAECTLVIFIIIIISWSIYALYKINVNGSDSILGLSISRLIGGPTEQQASGKLPTESPNSTAAKRLVGSQPVESSNKATIYLQPDEIRQRRNLLRELISAKQRQLTGQDTDFGRYSLRTPIAMAEIQQLRQNQQAEASPIFNQKSSVQIQDPRVINGLRNLLSRQLVHRGAQSDSESAEDELGERELSPTNEDESISTPQSDREPSESNIHDSELPTEDQVDENEQPLTTDAPSDQIGETGASQTEDGDTTRDDSGRLDEDYDNAAAKEPSESDQDSEPEQATAQDEAKAQETGKAIDEDVDRMTQPSSGIASRQERPSEYKNTVQFDDTIAGSSVVRAIGKSRQLPKREDVAGGLVPRFVAPTRRRDSDLQVDHNKMTVTKLDKVQPRTNTSMARPISRTTKAAKTHTRTKRWTAGKASMRLANSTLPAQKRPRQIARQKLRVAKNLTSRRSDDDYEYDSDDYEAPALKNEEVDKAAQDDNDRPAEIKRPAIDPSMYHYLTSNDTTLQELLNQQKLLDALTQSQLPGPVEPAQTALNVTHEGVPSEKQAADSFTIEEGLLLRPAGGEYHHSKEIKKKKAHKSKKKKKMTAAMKKGGHKKKKHKHEVKKYLKEKKFKGAKKGKKSSKGKGGQGGKKGKKFYKDKGFKKKGFKNVYHKEEFGQKKSYFDEFRDKDFKKKWKKHEDKYNYAKMKKWQGKDVKAAKKMKDQGEKFKKYDKGKWKKKYEKHHEEAKKKKYASEFD